MSFRESEKDEQHERMRQSQIWLGFRDGDKDGQRECTCIANIRSMKFQPILPPIDTQIPFRNHLLALRTIRSS